MTYDPFDEVRKMHEEMDRIFGRVFGARMLPHKGIELEKYKDFRMPLSDLKETDNKVIATFEIPGANKEDIDLNITENSIEVKAEQKTEKEIKEKGRYSYESRSHSFYRALPLPAEVKAEDAEARYKDGILKVEIPKVKKLEARKKKIEVK
jgi:HSP20 family protein